MDEAGERGCSRCEGPRVREGRASDFFRGRVVGGSSKEEGAVPVAAVGFAAPGETASFAPLWS
jgi:hypothetical protein